MADATVPMSAPVGAPMPDPLAAARAPTVDDIPQQQQQPEAGPSSPRRVPSPAPQLSLQSVMPQAPPPPKPETTVQALEDVEMTEAPAVAPVPADLVAESKDAMVVDPAPIAASQSDEADLLLSFSAERTDATVTRIPPPTGEPQAAPRLPDQPTELSGSPSAVPSFAQEPPPPAHRTTEPEGLVPAPNTEQRSASRSESPNMARQSPEPGTAPKAVKQKRKRNAAAGPSRRKSNDRAPLDGLPAHYMGENNEVIRCICGISEDTGLSVQCERCGAWQHSRCWGFVDGQILPDVWLCELCNPRPFDAARARVIQLDLLEEQHRKSDGIPAPPYRDEAMTPQDLQQQRQRGKPKRPRHGSTAEGDVDAEGKDGSPGVMGPPMMKPKRKPPGPKPRAKQVAVDSTPTPAVREPSVQQAEPEESPYFTLDPWELEYTPVRENLFRSTEARRKMCAMYQDWIEDEMRLSQKRSVDGPSGLPSPTETGVMRLSPDNVLPRPQFAILDPPLPPVYMSGKDIDSLAAPVTVRPVTDATSFLPLTYLEGISQSAIYTAPALYSVHTDEPLAEGAYIGEFRGEVLDCDTYRRDPINQYSSLGMPKPFVRAIAPPVDLLIDARGYGTVLRFIRSGCHPNVVIRPFFWRETETEAHKLRFGVYASRDIAKNEELVLGWEWDDHHAVHALSTCAQLTVLRDGGVGQATWTIPQQLKLVDSLIDKFDWVLTHLLGMFMPCACRHLGNCAIAQMRFLVETRGTERSSAGRRGNKADLGPLVGAVRGWRRRELEREKVKRWAIPDALFDLKPRPRATTASQAPVAPAGQPSHPVPFGQGVHDDTEEEELIEDAGDERTEQPLSDREDKDDVTERFFRRTPSPVPTDSSKLTPPETSPRERIRAHSGISLAGRPMSPTFQPPQADNDDGDESDATTVTLPRTVFSDTDNDDEKEEEEEMLESSPVKAAPLSGRKRRVPSPIPESSDMSSPPRAAAVHVTPAKRRKPGPKLKADKLVTDKKVKRPRAESDVRSRDDQIEAQRRKIRLFTSPPPSEEDRAKLGPKKALAPAPALAAKNEPRPATPPPREPTPPPKELTPEPPAPAPPKEPTPPPVEKKKVALADYLKTHKIRKETAATPTSGTPADTPVSEVPGSVLPATPGQMAPPAAESRSLNFSEFLPSARTPGMSAASTPGSVPAYTPRAQVSHQQDYFPPQPPGLGGPATPAAQSSMSSAAYQPRFSSSYTPRAASMSSEDSGNTPQPPSQAQTAVGGGAYVPRASIGPEPLDAQRRLTSLDEHLPPPARTTPSVQTKPLDDHFAAPQPPAHARPGDDRAVSPVAVATPRHNTVPMPPVEPTSPATHGPSGYGGGVGGGPSGGYAPFGQRRPSFSPQMSIAAIPPSPRDRASYLPPVLPTRDLPPHQQSPSALAERAALPHQDRDSRFERQTSETPRDRIPSGPRAPPTGPKVPPTGPRGTWNGPPSNSSGPGGPPGGGGGGGPAAPRVVSGGNAVGVHLGPGAGPGPGGNPNHINGQGPPGPAPPTSIYGQGGAGYGGPPRGGGPGGAGGSYGGHRGGGPGGGGGGAGYGDRGFYRGRGGFGRGRGRGG